MLAFMSTSRTLVQTINIFRHTHSILAFDLYDNHFFYYKTWLVSLPDPMLSQIYDRNMVPLGQSVLIVRVTGLANNFMIGIDSFHSTPKSHDLEYVSGGLATTSVCQIFLFIYLYLKRFPKYFFVFKHYSER